MDVFVNDSSEKSGDLGSRQLDEFLDDFTASDIDITNIRRLPVHPSDSLGVTSIPSRREGHSATMCEIESTCMLVVFGGRHLRDLTVLLPIASDIESLKLERVRYSFSSGVYSYDIRTSHWTLHQCTGRQPKERSDHSAVFVAPHFLLVVGGRGRSGMIFEDMFALSLVDWHWIQIGTRSQPSPRYWHGCCTVEESILVFGGKSEVQVFDDLQQLNISAVIHKLRLKIEQAREQQDPSLIPESVQLSVSWMNPNTVGKPPGARFGLRMVRIDLDRIAFVGGWRTSSKETGSQTRCIDVFILDTTMMVWTKPRYSSHICRLSAPRERFLFNCFCTHRSLVVFGGFTYSHDGETEAYSELKEDSHVIYKLDLHRMIWRRHVVSDPSEAALLSSAYPSFGSNAMLQHDGGLCTAFSCTASSGHPHVEVTATDILRRRRPLRRDDMHHQNQLAEESYGDR